MVGTRLNRLTAGANVYPQSMFRAKKEKNIDTFQLKIVIFEAEKLQCIVSIGVLSY